MFEEIKLFTSHEMMYFSFVFAVLFVFIALSDEEYLLFISGENLFTLYKKKKQKIYMYKISDGTFLVNTFVGKIKFITSATYTCKNETKEKNMKN